jgi:hypothetical protein
MERGLNSSLAWFSIARSRVSHVQRMRPRKPYNLSRTTNILHSVSKLVKSVTEVTEVVSALFSPKMYDYGKIVPVTARCNC